APEKEPSVRSPSHVWLSGYWDWQDHHWVWKPDESMAQVQSAANGPAPEPHAQASVPEAITPAPSPLHGKSSYWDNWIAPEKESSVRSPSHVRLSGYWDWQDHHWVWKPDERYVK
ncbi:hypothetical protein, partial [Nitrosospira sp. NpAV]|uniref:hypothetical protein n=1 Tax=Nitrosospira sp. NpAV TaxID=58133 RepID=UPI001E55092D